MGTGIFALIIGTLPVNIQRMLHCSEEMTMVDRVKLTKFEKIEI